MKVYNMTSNRTGKEVANQFEIVADNGDILFQSYNSIIAKKSKGEITLDSRYWDYSKTTGKYRNAFLRESKAETEAKIKTGEYKLANLNG
jgi:hypothetical protein